MGLGDDPRWTIEEDPGQVARQRINAEADLQDIVARRKEEKIDPLVADELAAMRGTAEYQKVFSEALKRANEGADLEKEEGYPQGPPLLDPKPRTAATARAWSPASSGISGHDGDVRSLAITEAKEAADYQKARASKPANKETPK